MLESGAVEAVVCVQSDDADRFLPKPVGCCWERICWWAAAVERIWCWYIASVACIGHS